MPEPTPHTIERDGTAVVCDDGQHDACLGTVHGHTWDAWPPRPYEGRCVCACHDPDEGAV